MVVRSIAIKEEAKNVMFWSKKRYIKGEKWFTSIDFGEHLRKSDVSEISKDSYEMNFMKGIVILVKNIWDEQYLEVC